MPPRRRVSPERRSSASSPRSRFVALLSSLSATRPMAFRPETLWSYGCLAPRQRSLLKSPHRRSPWETYEPRSCPSFCCRNSGCAPCEVLLLCTSAGPVGCARGAAGGAAARARAGHGGAGRGAGAAGGSGRRCCNARCGFMPAMLCRLHHMRTVECNVFTWDTCDSMLCFLSTELVTACRSPLACQAPDNPTGRQLCTLQSVSMCALRGALLSTATCASNVPVGVAAQPPAKVAGDDDIVSEPCLTPQPERKPTARRYVVPRQPGHAAKPPLSPMIAAVRAQSHRKSNLGGHQSSRDRNRSGPAWKHSLFVIVVRLWLPLQTASMKLRCSLACNVNVQMASPLGERLCRLGSAGEHEAQADARQGWAADAGEGPHAGGGGRGRHAVLPYHPRADAAPSDLCRRCAHLHRSCSRRCVHASVRCWSDWLWLPATIEER